jgi:hypothetical protein
MRQVRPIPELWIMRQLVRLTTTHHNAFHSNLRTISILEDLEIASKSARLDNGIVSSLIPVRTEDAARWHQRA